MFNAQLYFDMLHASLIIAQKYSIEIGTSDSSISKKLVVNFFYFTVSGTTN